MQNLWYDFGLGVGGSIIDLVMRLEQCDFTRAVRLLGSGGRTAISALASTSALPTAPALRILSDMPLRHPGTGRLSVITRNRPGNRIGPLPGGALCRWRTHVFRCRIPQRCRRLGTAFGAVQGLCVAQTGYDDQQRFRYCRRIRGFYGFSLLPFDGAERSTTHRRSSAELGRQSLESDSVSRTAFDDSCFLRQRRNRATSDRRIEAAMPHSTVIDQSYFYRAYKDLNEYLLAKRHRPHIAPIRKRGVKM